MSSNVSTPTLGPHPSQTLPPVSSSPLATNPPQGALDDDIPPLSLEILTTRQDKAAALRLVADSIAQQRQQAAFHLVFHPLPLAVLIAVLAAIYRHAWAANTRHDLGTALMLASSTGMTYLLAIRYVTAGYLRAAEALSWDFITAPNGTEDLVLGTRYGSDIIGALILRIERPSPEPTGNGSAHGHSRRKSHSRQNSLRRGGTGVIRAWTTRLRYRGRGIGGDMLREAVRLTRERCGRDAEVGFAREHANSVVVLPETFNKPLRKGEMRAARALEKVLGEWDGRRR
jgi:hypothetical protein